MSQQEEETRQGYNIDRFGTCAGFKELSFSLCLHKYKMHKSIKRSSKYLIGQLLGVELPSYRSLKRVGGGVVHTRLGITRELLKLRCINRFKLRAGEWCGDLAQGAGQCRQGTKRNIWLGLCGELVCEAGEVVALGECLEVVNAASQVLDVNTGKGVGGASVSKKAMLACASINAKVVAGATYPPTSKNLG